ncbi:hypothetical protein CIK05_03695 [Bdellovibrio sp. qaytius]|nr:hypothetical protein CIK05_03695 [Bdellovibrio sp. qaytius]
MLSNQKLEVMVLCMKKQFSLWIKHVGEQLMSRGKASDFQTLRLFAILAGLTFIFVVMLTIVQFSPTAPNHTDNKAKPELSAEAKLSP